MPKFCAMASRASAPHLAIGQRIKVFREALELTQAELGRRCYVSQPAVSAWERGTKLPARGAQHRIADELRSTRSIIFREVVEAENRAMVA